MWAATTGPSRRDMDRRLAALLTVALAISRCSWDEGFAKKLSYLFEGQAVYDFGAGMVSLSETRDANRLFARVWCRAGTASTSSRRVVSSRTRRLTAP